MAHLLKFNEWMLEIRQNVTKAKKQEMMDEERMPNVCTLLLEALNEILFIMLTN